MVKEWNSLPPHNYFSSIPKFFQNPIGHLLDQKQEDQLLCEQHEQLFYQQNRSIMIKIIDKDYYE
jgi:hypothetical protein